MVINDDVCILAHFEAALSVIDMHDAGRSQARHLDCIFQRNASFQHDGVECTFDRRFSFAFISDDVIFELLGNVLKEFGGRGGGKPDFSQGGVPDVAVADDVLKSLVEAVRKSLI